MEIVRLVRVVAPDGFGQYRFVDQVSRTLEKIGQNVEFFFQQRDFPAVHLDPETFRRIRTIEVYTDQSKVAYVNEMEWIKGEIWANVYMTDTIIRIDPQTGAVTGAIDMSGLLSEADVTPATDVLNGIAYDARTGRIFVTGKNWNKLFEISVHPK